MARRIPNYRRQKTKSVDRAFVELGGIRHYLGTYNSPESRAKYGQLLAEWTSSGGHPPVQPKEITVNELIARFWTHAETHYRRADGSSTDEQNNFRQALRPLAALYGATPVCEFGARRLKTVRDQMIELGWCRTNINKMVGRLRRLFRWGVENELVPAAVYQSLAALSGLMWGRSEAKESSPVLPVADDTFEATVAAMTPTLAAMATVQRRTGMRPGEVCQMRLCDIDMAGGVWTYRPRTHKTQCHGRDRVIFIGPRGQAVLRERLSRDVSAFLFTPAESEAERRATMSEARVTPKSCGNTPGSNRKPRPQRTPGECYDTLGYARAIKYACRRAFPAPEGVTGDRAKVWHREHSWSPNRLRHAFATEIRRTHGLEAAQVLLGHSRADVTQIYAERDAGRAIAVAERVG